MAATAPPKPRKRKQTSILFTPTQEAFLEQLKQEKKLGGDVPEIVRALVARELARWEELHRIPFPPVSESGEGE